MAHVGYQWPRVVSRDFKLYMSNDGGYAPPRKWRMRNLGPTHGTLAVPWLDLEFNSDVYEIASDRQSISWKFPHPDDSDDYVLLILTWFEHDSFEGGQFWNNQWWRFRGQYHHHGTMYANGIWKEWSPARAFLDDYADMGLAAGSSTTANPWFGCSNLPMFTNMGFTEMRCAKWSEQPEYHPYRYGP